MADTRFIRFVEKGTSFALPVPGVRVILRGERLLPSERTADPGRETVHGDVIIREAGRVPVISPSGRGRPGDGPLKVVVTTGADPVGFLAEKMLPAADLAISSREALPGCVRRLSFGRAEEALVTSDGVSLILSPLFRPEVAASLEKAPLPVISREEPSPGARLIVFPARAGSDSDWLAVAASQVAEGGLPEKAQPVPFATADIHGLGTWRGHAVLMLDVAHRLGFSDREAGPSPRLLVVQTVASSILVGLLVNRPVRLIDPGASTVAIAPPEGVNSGGLLGSFDTGAGKIHLLDVDSLSS